MLDEPDRAFSGFALGPRLFVSLDGLARTPLEGFGSRITYRTLARVPGEGEEAEALAALWCAQGHWLRGGGDFVAAGDRYRAVVDGVGATPRIRQEATWALAQAHCL